MRLSECALAPVLPQLIAFLSGLCALVYEVLWARTLNPVFGLSVPATTAVLCAFMAGLGLGSALAPKLLAGRRSAWRLYAGVELGIACLTPWIPAVAGGVAEIYAGLASPEASPAATAALRFGLSVVLLLPASTCMGLTLPVLVEACRELSPEDPLRAERVGRLYGLNTLGGALGCFAVGFVLLPSLGVRASTAATAAVNLGLAALAWGISRRVGEQPAPAVQPGRQLLAIRSAVAGSA